MNLGELISQVMIDTFIVYEGVEETLSYYISTTPSTLTDAAKEMFAKALDARVVAIEYRQIVVTGKHTEDFAMFYEALVGNCPSKDYEKWFRNC